jgi:hypothetical protein
MKKSTQRSSACTLYCGPQVPHDQPEAMRQLLETWVLESLEQDEDEDEGDRAAA